MASSLRQLQRKRLAQPPSTGSFGVDFWFRQVADTFNQLPPMSVFSFTNPNSNLSAIPGTLGFNINSANTAKLWVKEVGSGNTGWNSLVTHPLTSIRTAASVDSLNLGVNEVMFSLHASGASLGVRSGGTIWFFASSMSTKG